MLLLKSDNILEHLSNLIHKDTQQNDSQIDLTVNEIHQITKAGSLDFGGSEFEPVQSVLLKPEKQNPEDDYGWWKLSKGTYRAFFNETLDNPKDITSLISLHDHAQDAGLISSTVMITEPGKVGRISMNFHVPEAGCNIKENARLAMLHMLKE
ncbi:hypothetical protein [Gracilimonas sp.]|uniref:hypothetical protein n=1 Tax=Gracilimonas sp. TaxID=1974203 RepID=UPI0028716118|nr:hypothetical protein [Gracilimonas sp.]